jgi:hypothetical protein
MMQKFWELMSESTITQAAITVIALGLYGYMVVMGMTVPPTLESIVTLVVGFFFGGKLGFAQGQNKALKSGS